MRTVILLTGPPGAGKTTWARATGLTHHSWETYPSEKQFKAALRAIAEDPGAQTVVERCAPTAGERITLAMLCRATHIFIMPTPPAECHSRIEERDRPAKGAEHKAVQLWWARFENHPGHIRPPDPALFTYEKLNPKDVREW